MLDSRRTSLVVLLATLGVVAAAVLPDVLRDEPVRPEPWHLVDLAARPYRVEARSRAQVDVHVTAAPRGAQHPVPGRPWKSPEVMTLRQAVSSRVSWRVDLGRDPYLAVAPLGTQRPDCRGEQRVSVRDAAGITTVLLSRPLRPARRFAPARKELALAPWADQEVELVLEVLPAPGSDPAAKRWRPCRGVWGGVAVLSRSPLGERAAPSEERSPAPNVILIGLDTFRADHWTSRPSNVRSFTPALDRLAAESDVFTQAYSTFNNTNPSFVSIHTGRYGRSHGIYDLRTPLPEEHFTLAEHFREAGYATAAFVAARHLLPAASGLGQGFDVFEGPAGHTVAASLVVDRAVSWLETRTDRSEPFFVWVHLFDVHTPTVPPEPYASGIGPGEPTGLSPTTSWVPFRSVGYRQFSEVEYGGHPDLYAGAAAYLDRQIDRLLGFLESRDLLERTFFVVVGDHGESLGEHGILHSHFGLYDPSVHVPLVVRWPDAWTPRGLAPGAPRGRRLDELVQTVDLFPSLLAATDLDERATQAGEGIEGVDLWDASLPEATSGRARREVVFAEHANGEGAMIRTRRYKYIVMEPNAVLPAGPYLFDLAADPGENVNLAGRGLAIEDRLAKALAEWRAGGVRVAPSRDAPDDADLESLRALGYLE